MNDRIRIRDAVRDDIDTLVEFNRQMARETEGKQLDKTILTAGVKAVFNNHAHGFYLVAEVDGTIAGSLLVTTEWSDWRNGVFWWIQSVYVAPAFRRKGVYRSLYREVRERAGRSSQVCGCRLYVERENHTAQATYKYLGMKDTGYRVFEEMIFSQS
jgi:ribosomal protein S18 acetylase RimI-like enzyme